MSASRGQGMVSTGLNYLPITQTSEQCRWCPLPSARPKTRRHKPTKKTLLAWHPNSTCSNTRRVYKTTSDKTEHCAMAGNRTRVNCLGSSYANHYTTIACISIGRCNTCRGQWATEEGGKALATHREGLKPYLPPFSSGSPVLKHCGRVGGVAEHGYVNEWAE